MEKINIFLDEHKDKMIDELEKIVNIDSGSYDKEGVDRMVDICKDKFAELGFSVEVDQQKKWGNNLLARKKGELAGNILFIGHLDTVFKKGTAAERPFTIKGDYAYGPGVCDMKGGVIVLYYALKALLEHSKEPLPDLTIILNGDEEIGSLSSRPLIEREAKKATYCFILEPGREDGSVVTSRKGVGDFELTIEGTASHAGSHHSDGRSAIEELAHKIIALHKLTDYEKGITVNVGVVQGGERSNIVADKATAQIDLRIKKIEDADPLIAKMQEITAHSTVEGTTAKLTGGINRPPLVKSSGGEKLYQIFKKTAKSLGIAHLGEKTTGGGSDGNFVSALGVPTIDALGPVGGNCHNEKEYLEVSTLTLRAKLLAQSIIKLSKEDI